MMQSASYVRPMTTRQIYDAAFALYRRHYRPLLAINFIYTVLVLGLVQLNRPGLLRLGPALPFLLELAQIYIYAVVVIAASNAVLGRPVRVLQAFQRAAAPRVLAKILVFALPLPLARMLFLALFPQPAAPPSSASALPAYLTGGLLLFLVGFAARVLFLYSAPVSVLEKRGLVDSLRRVLRLSGAFAGQNFYRYGLFFVPFQLLRSLASGAFVYAAFILAALTQSNVGPVEMVLLQQIPLGLVILLLNPLGNLVATLLYYDARARLEHYHEEALAEEMGYQPITEWITA